jgi:adenine-specific DNA methylase
MRTKYSSNSELSHIWANDPDSGVYKSANSMSCQHGKLYSYSTVIAQIIGDTVIYNTASYSNTTSKHQGYARQATNHFEKRIYLSVPKMNLSSLELGQADFQQLVLNYNEQTLILKQRKRIHHQRTEKHHSEC